MGGPIRSGVYSVVSDKNGLGDRMGRGSQAIQGSL